MSDRDDELMGEEEKDNKFTGFGIEEDEDEVGAVIDPEETEEDELEATGMHIEDDEEPEDSAF